ncbi:DREPP plasma membrane polypeptide [Cynara cardunculus var. scolymus]|uniref:DREPP plasma membrane polypeptide n=1 Tax=Cynara cardunculus var. scolymus TaxID=59895 RepID=A0A103QLC0_CYNCS|nr:DREPP plasma membrane polypeptide [Cynara cardunculus var. scolymus]
MGYWKSTVVPKFKKIFEKNSTKKTAAAEACKSFDDAKALVKEPKEASLKKNSAVVTSFLEELSKIEFPGSKPAHEACSKFGPTLVQGPIFFVFEKVSTFIVVEEKETTSSKEKDVVVEEEKKEEAAAAEGEVAKTEAEEVVVAPAEPPKTS